MVTASEFWRPIIRDFQPVGPVQPEEVRRFFVDRHADDPTQSLLQLLKSSLLNNLSRDLSASPTFYKGLLTGHVGSGKSSELMRLGQELADTFFVVGFDAEFTLTLETANHFDVLLGMGVAIHKEAQAARLNPRRKLTDDLLKSMAKLVRKYENRQGFTLNLEQLLKQVATTGINYLVPGGGAAVAATVGATKLALNVNDDFVKLLELPANRAEVIGALNEIITWVEKKAGKPLLMITDGLDKVPVARARLFFAESALLCEPACALIYAAPIEFYHRVAAAQSSSIFDELKMLPIPPVSKRPLKGDDWRSDREAEDAGLAVMRQVVAKRLAAHSQPVDAIITPEALSMLARSSGGVMRELIRYFRNAATFAQMTEKMQIDETTARRAINQQRKEIKLRLTVAHREALQRVLQQGNLSGGQPAVIEIEDELLRYLYLLSYESADDAWFDAHPNVLAAL